MQTIKAFLAVQREKRLSDSVETHRALASLAADVARELGITYQPESEELDVAQVIVQIALLHRARQAVPVPEWLARRVPHALIEH